MTGCASKQEIRDRIAAALEGRGGYARLTLTGELAPDVDLQTVDFEDLPNGLDSPPIIRLGSVTVAYDLARIGQEPTGTRTIRSRCAGEPTVPRRTSTRHSHGASRARRARRLGSLSDVRIESVTAVAFGPLRGVTLQFAPQLTVILWTQRGGQVELACGNLRCAVRDTARSGATARWRIASSQFFADLGLAIVGRSERSSASMMGAGSNCGKTFRTWHIVQRWTRIWAAMFPAKF